MLKDITELSDNFTEQLHKTVGLNVKRVRSEKGISQLKLATSIGYKSVSPVSSAEIYYKKIHFNLENLAKIAFVLDVEIAEFFKPLE